MLEAARSLTRDHTQQDVFNAQRLLTGEITPEDREQYKTTVTLNTIIPSVMRRPPDPTSFLSLLSLECIIIIQELERLPNEEIDRRIRQQAAQQLERWQQTSLTPGVDETRKLIV